MSKKNKQSKMYQIYGVFADGESDDEQEESGRSGRKTKDYSAPVDFVSGGVQESGKNKPEDETEREPENRPAFGSLHTFNEYSSDEEEDFSQKEPMSVFEPTASSKQNKNLGAWQQHTRGIGEKLMKMMGYEPGKGLGKDLQGISQPVEAHLRKGRGAIGAYGPEKVAKPNLKGMQKQEEPRTLDQKNKWKRNKGKDTQYKSVQEVISQGQHASKFTDKLSKELGNVTVIDMTGPERRVLSGYNSLRQTKIFEEDLYFSNKKKPEDSQRSFKLDELSHNLNLMVNICEQEIISLDKTERDCVERSKQLKADREALLNITKLEQDHIQTLENFYQLFEELSSPGVTSEQAEVLFVRLRSDYKNEFIEFELDNLIPEVVAPILNNLFLDWNALDNPKEHLSVLLRWKAILKEDNAMYYILVWDTLVPVFQRAADDWNPRNNQPMASLLDAWVSVLPSKVLDNILDQLILPKLQQTVEIWDPLTDTMPIHIWILPWNSILSFKMEHHIYPIIRSKLGKALQSWMPYDRSARAMLTPWKFAFEEGAMQAFLTKHIEPKLVISLTELIINPLQQDFECWNQVSEWNDLFSVKAMAALLDKYFFTKWMQTLIIWLNQCPDFEQITNWYTMWKSQIPENLLLETSIKEHFRRALEIMHRATDGVPVGTTIQTDYTPKPPSLMELDIPPPPQIEFKDLVIQKCSELGIIFTPMPGRRENGKQVFRCGKLFCYIDKKVLMVSDGNFVNWVPTSLNILLEKARH